MSIGKKACPECGGKMHRGYERCANCRDGKRVRTTIATILGEADVLKFVKRQGGATPQEIATALKTTPGAVLDQLIKMKEEGRRLYQFGDKWAQEQAPVGGIWDKPLVSDKDGWHIVGAMGDTHMCSKHERVEELHDLYRIYAANGVKTVLHTGNYIDGEARFNKHELLVHGMDAQLRYMGERYPQIPGITTLAVSGDDHEGWYSQREGVDIGAYMQTTMERGGRSDIKNLGYMECYIPLVHAKSGKQTMIHVMHPGGGSAYATSYTVQKIVEGYEGGEKPAVLLAGHYHKSEHLEVRNVHCFQTGCFQDQTVFARKKKLTFSIGGWLLLLRQNPETGAIEEVVSYFKKYYNRGYYVNQRWSLSGPVAQVPRLSL